MNRVATNFVPRLLTEDQTNYRVEVAQNYLKSIRKKQEVFKKVISRDQLWVYGYDPEIDAQFSQQKKRLESNDQRKRVGVEAISRISMLNVTFEQEEIIYHEYAPKDKTENKECFTKKF